MRKCGDVQKKRNFMQSSISIVTDKVFSNHFLDLCHLWCHYGLSPCFLAFTGGVVQWIKEIQRRCCIGMNLIELGLEMLMEGLIACQTWTSSASSALARNGVEDKV
mmetsp:Transcript_20602/g.48888  ORF Transcript_20602/g.48888 Transcript_20602/m.48888 type:complete len:106 (+) Transcript_20602:264-581(+)